MSLVSHSSIVLADRATRIAKERSISFGEALPVARREMAAEVRENSGSPLRAQAQSTVPAPSAVRQAVVEGLGENTTMISQSQLLGAVVVNLSVEAVGAKWKALGLGPQIVSALQGALNTFLSNLLKPSLGQPDILSSAQVNAAITQAADYMQQAYTSALANKVNTQVWGEGKVQVLVGGHVEVSSGSVRLREMAEKIAKNISVNFGEALRIARYTMAADVIEPEQIRSTVESALSDVFTKIFNGKQEKIIGRSEVFQAVTSVSQALDKLNLGSVAGALNDDLSDFLEDQFKDGAVVNSSAAKVISGKAADRLEAVYAKEIAAMR